jgi:hypothetical protein
MEAQEMISVTTENGTPYGNVGQTVLECLESLARQYAANPDIFNSAASLELRVVGWDAVVMLGAICRGLYPDICPQSMMRGE